MLKTQHVILRNPSNSSQELIYWASFFKKKKSLAGLTGVREFSRPKGLLLFNETVGLFTPMNLVLFYWLDVSARVLCFQSLHPERECLLIISSLHSQLQLVPTGRRAWGELPSPMRCPQHSAAASLPREQGQASGKAGGGHHREGGSRAWCSCLPSHFLREHPPLQQCSFMNYMGGERQEDLTHGVHTEAEP